MSETDIELDCHHAGGLMDHRSIVEGIGQHGLGSVVVVVVLQVKQHLGGCIGEGQSVEEFTRAETPRGTAVEVQDAEADGSQLQRKSEDRADAGSEHSWTESWPTSHGVLQQIGLEYRASAARRVDTWALAKGELQLLHLLGRPVGGGNDAAGGPIGGHQR